MTGETTTVTTPQVGTDTVAQVATQAATAAATATSDQASSGAELTAEQLRVELAATRKEAARYRTERNEFEKKVQAFENEKLSESERLKKEAEEARAETVRLKTAAREARIKAVAAQLGFHDPADGLAIGELDDEAEIKTALESLATKKTYLVKPKEQPVTTSASNAARSTQTANPFNPNTPPSLANPNLWKR